MVIQCFMLELFCCVVLQTDGNSVSTICKYENDIKQFQNQLQILNMEGLGWHAE